MENKGTVATEKEVAVPDPFRRMAIRICRSVLFKIIVGMLLFFLSAAVLFFAFPSARSYGLYGCPWYTAGGGKMPDGEADFSVDPVDEMDACFYLHDARYHAARKQMRLDIQRFKEQGGMSWEERGCFAARAKYCRRLVRWMADRELIERLQALPKDPAAWAGWEEHTGKDKRWPRSWSSERRRGAALKAKAKKAKTAARKRALFLCVIKTHSSVVPKPPRCRPQSRRPEFLRYWDPAIHYPAFDPHRWKM